MKAFKFYGLGVILYLHLDSAHVRDVAQRFASEGNLIGWYVYDEPATNKKSVEEQDKKIKVLKEIKNIPCFAAENMDFYCNTAGWTTVDGKQVEIGVSQNYDYIFISQYYNFLNNVKLESDADILKAYGLLTSYGAYGMDKLLPIYETYGSNLGDTDKLLNNMLVKKRLFKHNGVFFIYSAKSSSHSMIGLFDSKELRDVAKTVMSTPISNGDMIIRGINHGEKNSINKWNEFIEQGSRALVFPRGKNTQLPYNEGVFFHAKGEYLMVNFGKRVSCARFAYRWNDAQGGNRTHTFDIGVPVDDKRYRKIGQLTVNNGDVSITGGIVHNVKNVFNINSDRLIIVSTTMATGYQFFSGFVVVGIKNNIETTSEIESEDLIYYGNVLNDTMITNTSMRYHEDIGLSTYAIPKGGGQRIPKWWRGDTFLDALGFYPSRRVGTTEERPDIFGYGFTDGFMYYDTTLKKPIWWSGTKWLDAMGNVV